MHCKKCGFEIKNNHKFCSNCGMEISDFEQDKLELKKLLTSEDFSNYVITNKTGNESLPGWMKKHFKVVEQNLVKNEHGLVSFMLMIGNSSKRIAGVLTNKRLIIAQEKLVGNQLITISINNINDIYMKKGLIDGTLIIDSFKETLVFVGLKKLVENTNNALNNALNEIKNNLINDNTIKINDTQPDSKYDKLTKLKKLLDENIINQKEFEEEKQKILNS